MKTSQLQELIQAATGRPLTIHGAGVEIPLASKVHIFRPYGAPGRAAETLAFEWKTPKKEDSILRSFITAFCSKYKEPDPATYSRNCSCYGDTWARYETPWNDPATHWICAPWGHHVSHMLSKAKLQDQVRANFATFDSGMARLGFYETNYGIGLFTVYGGAWITTALSDMARYLDSRGVPFRNELSEAGWVTRFVIGADKPQHAAILGSY